MIDIDKIKQVAISAKANGDIITIGADKMLELVAELERNREVMRMALAQLEINRTNMNKGMSKSMSRCLAGGNDDVINTLKEAVK